MSSVSLLRKKALAVISDDKATEFHSCQAKISETHNHCWRHFYRVSRFKSPQPKPFLGLQILKVVTHGILLRLDLLKER